MDKIAEFLGGEGNRETIDWNYEKALKKAGEDRAKAVEQAWYDTDLYNKNKDYFDSIGIDRPTSAAEVSSVWGKEMDALEKERKKAWEQNKYNIAGNGIIGEILNPVAQTASLAGDMFASPFRAMAGEETNRYKRDKENDGLSDIGATLETALLLGSGGAARGTSSLGKAALKGAATGAGYGAVGSLREMGAKNFDLGKLALSTGIGAGVGGALGGGMYGLGKVWNKYTQPAPGNSLVPYSGETSGASNKYQGYLKTLEDSGLDTSSADALKKSYRKVIKPLHPDRAAQGTSNEELFKTITDAYKAFYGENGEEFADAMAKATNPVSRSSSANVFIPKQSFGQKLKNFGSNIPNMGRDLANTKAGTKVASLLKTKTGKIGAGLGGGLLLSKLMSGNKDQKTLTNDELQQLLYNYNYGGQ